MFSDESQYCRDKWVCLWTGGCQDKLMTQVVQADPFRDSVGGVGLLWVYCRVVRPACSCSPSSAENKSTNLKTHGPRIFKASWGYVNAHSNPMRLVLLSLFYKTGNWTSEAMYLISSKPWIRIQSPLNDRALIYPLWRAASSLRKQPRGFRLEPS